MNELSDRINQILENPESLRMISQIAENFMSPQKEPDAEKKHDEISESHQEESRETMSVSSSGDEMSLLPMLGRLVESSDIGKTSNLIKALKPYMSSRRRESADSVLRLLGVIGMFGNNNISDFAKLLLKKSE